MTQTVLHAFELVEGVPDTLSYGPRETDHENCDIVRRLIPDSRHDECQNHDSWKHLLKDCDGIIRGKLEQCEEKVNYLSELGYLEALFPALGWASTQIALH